MQKRGLEATGILANVCKTAGFGSVSDLLQKNPTAKRAILDVPRQEARTRHTLSSPFISDRSSRQPTDCASKLGLSCKKIVQNL